MGKISVVVPIYNVEKYLRKCVDSIINQTYDNLEIILVDDGSPDGCGKICDNYAEIDDRIRVIHQKNKGLSGARNSGIKIATGKYICFIDSDDYISLDMIKYLYDNMVNTDSCISVCGFYNVNSDYEILGKKSHKEKIKIYNNIDSISKMLYNKEGIDIVTWNKLYKMDLFADIKFPDGKIYEDFYTIPQVFFKAKKIVVSNERKYFYLHREDSITGKKDILLYNKKNDDLIENLNYMYSFIEKNCIDILIKFIPGYLLFNLVSINKMIDANIDNERMEYINKIVYMDRKNILNILFNKYLKIKEKVKLILFLNFKIYKKVYKMKV